MNLPLIGVPVLFERDAGTLVLYALAFPQGCDLQSVAMVLLNIPVEAELSATDPADCECELEVKRVPGGYATKRGCHGAFGTWNQTSLQEAAGWLLPGILLAAKRRPLGVNASLAVPKAKNGA